MLDFKDMEGAHFGCNYLSKPGTICNKCGRYVQRDIDKEAHELIQRGHFELTSGLHSDTYIDKFAAFTYPEFTEKVCYQMAKPFRDAGITIVIGPAIGGVILAHGVAKELNARCAFVERDGDKFQLKRFSIKPEDKILLVDDVLTTGFSVRQMIEAISEFKSQIHGLSLMMDRSVDSKGEPVQIDVPIVHRVFSMWIKTYQPKDCPQCHGTTPSTAIRKGSRPAKPKYDWVEHSETIEHKATLCETNDKWDIEAEIDYNNHGGPSSAQIEVSLYLDKFKSKDGFGHKMVRNENWFLFEVGRGYVKDLQKDCEEFYEKHLKGKELTTEFLQGLHKELSNKV